mmetsp:Transcript_9171/g.16865  ORF Transcript_9171/g.16865 Transcript_9171/m.16865 type:complete len:142 (+) Transcript_9171:623-1048(+)
MYACAGATVVGTLVGTGIAGPMLVGTLLEGEKFLLRLKEPPDTGETFPGEAGIPDVAGKSAAAVLASIGGDGTGESVLTTPCCLGGDSAGEDLPDGDDVPRRGGTSVYWRWPTMYSWPTACLGCAQTLFEAIRGGGETEPP